MALHIPPHLSPGDRIRVVAPASPFDRAKLESGINILNDWGFKVDYDDGIFESAHYLAGSDRRRAEELNAAAADPEIQAVWAVRGGFGCMRILNLLDYETIRNNRKLWLGFSDVTVLHHAIQSRARLATLHGPVLASLADTSPDARQALLSRLIDPSAPGGLFPEPVECWHKGRATGRLMPGNLTMLCHLMGTSWMPVFDGAILAIEDVNEPAYRIDRLLTHLEISGVIGHLSGLAFGQLSLYGHHAEPDTPERVKARVQELAKRYNLPTIGNCPFGHVHDNYPLPVGLPVRLNADAGRLTLDAPFVE